MQQQYQSQFGSFIAKYQLGGIIPREVTGDDAQSMQVQRLAEIENSREARRHFFTQAKQEELRSRIAGMSEEQRQKIDSGVVDGDMVTFFNRTKASAEDKQLKTIPGCFYKVRAQGSATQRDSEELNKFYKRAIVSCAAAIGHAFVTVQFLYQSRLLTRRSVPRVVFDYTPYVIYPAAVVGLCVFMVRENKRILDRLDSKYTPLWVRMTEEQAATLNS